VSTRIDGSAIASSGGRPSSIRDRLSRTAGVFSTSLGGIRQRSGITRETWDDLEAMLLRADVGVRVTKSVLQDLRSRVDAKEIRDGEELVSAVRMALTETLLRGSRTMSFGTVESGRIDVWLLVGVNGVGKTTTVGKLAAQQAGSGRRVLLAAGDTFRAAAAEQLEMWGERTGVDVVRGSEGGDPSSVVFDAIHRGASRDYDLIIADTAGRLHTKSNLMEELRKVRRIADREPGSVTEVLLVIDATTGQNGLAQARQFAEAAGVTGVVLTKLDGSAKGGIVFAIESELGLPVKFVGVGETVGDLVPFDTDEFVSALFDV
jgi:fused signal recognition particle receptor